MSESWNTPNRQCCAVLPTWQILSMATCVMKLWSSIHGVKTLHNCSVLLLANSSMNFHVIRPHDCFCVRFSHLVIFQFLQQKFVIRTSHLFIKNILVRFAITLSTSQKKRGQRMMLVLQDQPASSMSSKWEPHSALFPAIPISSTYTDKNNPCFR